MGFEPGETSPGGGGGRLTGKFREEAPWPFACEDGSHLWIGIYSPNSCFITGELAVQIPYQG
jgi:hypothetical protein